MSDEPRGLEKLLADEVERFGIDYVRGLTDKPERQPPPHRRRPLDTEPPTGPHDFRPSPPTPPTTGPPGND